MEQILRQPLQVMLDTPNGKDVILIDIIGPHTLEAESRHRNKMEEMMAIDSSMTFITEEHDGLVFITLEEV